MSPGVAARRGRVARCAVRRREVSRILGAGDASGEEGESG